MYNPKLNHIFSYDLITILHKIVLTILHILVIQFYQTIFYKTMD